MWNSYLHRDNGKVYTYARPVIQLQMNDEDVVARVASIFGRAYWDRPATEIRNTAYTTRLDGDKAIGWMMTLYPLLGHRRKAKVMEVIKAWKKYKSE